MAGERMGSSGWRALRGSSGEARGTGPGKVREKTMSRGRSAPGLVPGHFPAFVPIGSSSYSSVSTPDPTLAL